jgi:hypothetical protein
MLKDMLRPLRRFAAIVIALGTFASSAAAQTEDINRLVDNLKNGPDFRIRTQAALALGASKNSTAVQPLCAGLSDANTTVRAAAAAALGKLNLGGQECLNARLASEPSETVKAAIQRAMQQLAGGAEPVFLPSTKYYLQLGRVSDKSGRTDGSVDRLFRDGFVKAAGGTGGVLFAPLAETPDQAKKRLTGKKVKAFYLAVSVPAFEYVGSKLTVRAEIAVFSYPGKVMIGTIKKNASFDGISGPDPASEDELLAYAGEAVFKQFAAAPQFQ